MWIDNIWTRLQMCGMLSARLAYSAALHIPLRYRTLLLLVDAQADSVSGGSFETIPAHFNALILQHPASHDPPAVYLSSSIFQSPASSWGRSEHTDRNVEL